MNKKNLARLAVLAIACLLVCAPRIYNAARKAEGLGMPNDPPMPQASSAPVGPIGLFESHADIGSVLHPGSVE